MNWYKKTVESEKNHSIIVAMKKEFVIMRGLPGSGKSTLAKQLAGTNGQIFSADDFFMDTDGNYNFDPSKLGQAHEWNYNRIREAISAGASPVILDNTNVAQWELRKLKPLIEHATLRGYKSRIEEPQTPWAMDPEELAKRNTHGVPQEAIEGKLRKWVKDPTIEDIQSNFGIPQSPQ
ncbi:MAG: AAA family ATPase [Candidatus Asgardarchaeia archaeon]